jgi:hypothetical protein
MTRATWRECSAVCPAIETSGPASRMWLDQVGQARQAFPARMRFAGHVIAGVRGALSEIHESVSFPRTRAGCQRL